MKICSIRIKGYQQFADTFFDFTNPATGLPVDKVCFIGRNGTGKSTVLRLINDFLLLNFSDTPVNFLRIPFLSVKLHIDNQDFYWFYSCYYTEKIIFKSEIDSVEDWFEKLSAEKNGKFLQETLKKFQKFQLHEANFDSFYNFLENLKFRTSSPDLLIYSPAESPLNHSMQVSNVPLTSLNQAISLFKNFPFHHTISDQNVEEFWKVLIYLIKKRENEREEFENKEENLVKTKKELIEEFEKFNPKILNKLADLWNKILDKAGLEFDVKNASNPIQLNDNLLAYIRLKSNQERINYNQLSTGIRNFIFRVGHIYALYFNREIKRGFLLLDEPENSLFPDFLFDLIETYQELLKDKNGENNTQFFVSTHNPIIAAQFEPYERVILEWNENGSVDASKGHAPAGDDPNDVLTQDFGLKNLMGKEGQKQWKEYLDLRKKLRKANNEEEKKDLMSKINRIGTAYNFEE